MNKEFMIWFHAQKTPFVTYEQVLENYKENTAVVYDSLKPYFDITKDKEIKLNSNYAIGNLQIKRSIAFLLSLKSLTPSLISLRANILKILILYPPCALITALL